MELTDNVACYDTMMKEILIKMFFHGKKSIENKSLMKLNFMNILHSSAVQEPGYLDIST